MSLSSSEPWNRDIEIKLLCIENEKTVLSEKSDGRRTIEQDSLRFFCGLQKIRPNTSNVEAGAI
jgi:hypothetical protein